MKRTLSITGAVLLGASLLASPVMAQVSVGADVGVGGAVGIGTGGSNGSDANASGSAEVDGSVSAGSSGDDGGVNAGGSLNADANVDGNLDDDDDGANASAGSNADTDTNANADADDGDDTDDTTTASTGDDDNGFEGFIDAINSSSGVQAAQGFTAGQTITVVRADTFCESDLEQQCVDAMNSNQAGMADVQGAIEENETLSSALGSQNVETSSVVAARENADGSMTIFTQ